MNPISLQYKCGYCSELFRHREYLRRHIRMSCETKKAGQKDTRVACEECGLLLTAKQMFDHKLTHGKDSIPCPQPGCSHVSKSKKHAHQHQTRKHIMATCDICGWHGTKYGMTRHKKTHLENDKVTTHGMEVWSILFWVLALKTSSWPVTKWFLGLYVGTWLLHSVKMAFILS